MSRFGLGNIVAKTVLRYPLTRFKRAIPFKQVSQYPKRRLGSRNDALDVFNFRNPALLTLDSLTTPLSSFTLGDVTPFVVTLTVTNSGDNDLNLDSVALTFDNGGDVSAEFPSVADGSNATVVAAGDTEALLFTVTPDVAPTAGTVTIGASVTASDASTSESVTPSGTPTDSVVANNVAVVELTTLSEDTGGSVSKTAGEPEFSITLRVSNTASAPANDVLTTALAFTFTHDPTGSPSDVTSEYSLGAPSPALGNTAQGAFTDYVIPVTISDIATEGTVRIAVDTAGSTFEDAVESTPLTETDNTTPQDITVTA